jgi:hypothetical protein
VTSRQDGVILAAMTLAGVAYRKPLCRCRRFMLIRQVLGRARGPEQVSASGLTLASTASRRHGAQRQPGCGLELQPVATCFPTAGAAQAAKSCMQLSFIGAAQEVTGSCFLVETGGLRFLVDCGMFQGGREARERNLKAWPFDPRHRLRAAHARAHRPQRPAAAAVRAGLQGPIHTTAPPPTCCR